MMQLPKRSHEFLIKRIDRTKKFTTVDLTVESGDEYDYTYVVDGGSYSANTFMKKGVLVLPTKPHVGFQIFVSDQFGSWKWYPLMIHRNGQRIMGIEENMECDMEYAVFKMIYVNPSIGWKVEDGL